MQREEYERSWNHEVNRMSQNQKCKAFFLNKTDKRSQFQDSAQIREKFRKYAIDANSDDGMAKKAALEGACRELEFFMTNVINRKFSTYTKKDPDFFDELLQAGRLGIILSLPKYDAEKSMPTTYFFTAIMHEMTALVNCMKHGTKSHMATLKRKVQEVDKTFEKYGRTPSLHDYVYCTGSSFNRILNVLAQMTAGNATISIDDPDNASSIDNLSSACSPEEIAASKVEAGRIIQLAREIEPDEVIVRCFIKSSIDMANASYLAEKYNRSPSEITDGILRLKNRLKNHKDVRRLYSEYF